MPCVAGTRSFAFVVVWKERNRSTVSLYDTLRLSKPFLWHNGMKAERYKNKALCYNCLIYMSIIWYESVIDCWCTEWWSPKTCSHFEGANVAEFLFSTRLDAAPFFFSELSLLNYTHIHLNCWMYPVMTVDWREEHSDTISLDVWQPMLYAEDMLQFISLVAFHEWSKWTLLSPFFFLSRHWLTSTVRSPTQIWIHKMVSSLKSGNKIRGSWYRFG